MCAVLVLRQHHRSLRLAVAMWLYLEWRKKVVIGSRSGSWARADNELDSRAQT
jgi:hypothetical protein